MRSRLALAALLLTGCMDANLVPCGTLACPSGFVCTAGGCATPESAAACAGKLEGDRCTTIAITNGACHGETCRPIACGDGALDPGEACDDMNTTPGDGCSATCESTEACGNDIVDLAQGEQCDDALAGLSHDGCSSTCGLEIETWRDVTPRDITGRTLVTMAYDTKRGVIVLFGGATFSEINDETWTFDGVWRRVQPETTPPARSRPVMVYDRARDRIVMFGGVGAAGALSDTWEWDGTDWIERHPTTFPPARSTTPGAAYDVEHQRVVLLNAGAAYGDLGETWEWDGTAWVQRATTVAPVNAYYVAMTYDTVRMYALLVTSDGVTWQWDGNVWLERTDVAPLQPRNGRGLTFDEARGVAVLVGGKYATVVGDTVEWDGTGWTTVADLVPPRTMAAVAYDDALQAVVAFGGETGTFPNGSLLADTWVWNGTTWVEVKPPVEGVRNPHRREGPGMVYDPLHGRTLLFGGCLAPFSACFGDTWAWNGTSWSSVQPAATGGPSIREGVAMTFDTVRGRTLLFGGSLIDPFEVYGDTWDFDSTWVPLSPAQSPEARTGAALTFDDDRGRAVLFGGQLGSGVPVADTWEWDGTTWIERPVSGPSARAGAVLVYDRARKQTLLFGGIDGNSQPLADTWLWDGTAWQLVATPMAPPARGYHGLAYDPLRQRVLLFGGDSIAAVLGDVWEWDGTTWKKSGVAGPPPRSGNAVVFDAIRGVIVNYGGRSRSLDNLGDTWTHRYDAPVPEERCLVAATDGDGDGLAGCADPDCWGRCAPLCPPGESCPAQLPRCGDGACGATEDARICPADCL